MNYKKFLKFGFEKAKLSELSFQFEKLYLDMM